MYTARSNKKHKVYKDGYLEVTPGKRAVLKSDENKQVSSRLASSSAVPLSADDEFDMGAYEVVIVRRVASEDFKSGRIFTAAALSASATASAAGAAVTGARSAGSASAVAQFRPLTVAPGTNLPAPFRPAAAAGRPGATAPNTMAGAGAGARGGAAGAGGPAAATVTVSSALASLFPQPAPVANGSGAAGSMSLSPPPPPQLLNRTALAASLAAAYDAFATASIAHAQLHNPGAATAAGRRGLLQAALLACTVLRRLLRPQLSSVGPQSSLQSTLQQSLPPLFLSFLLPPALAPQLAPSLLAPVLREHQVAGVSFLLRCLGNSPQRAAAVDAATRSLYGGLSNCNISASTTGSDGGALSVAAHCAKAWVRAPAPHNSGCEPSSGNSTGTAVAGVSDLERCHSWAATWATDSDRELASTAAAALSDSVASGRPPPSLLPALADAARSRGAGGRGESGGDDEELRLTAGFTGCVLGDEMGLGKTLQTIAALYCLFTSHPLTAQPVPVGLGTITKAVVVCPSTLTANWQREFAKWLGTHRLNVSVLSDATESAAAKKARKAATAALATTAAAAADKGAAAKGEGKGAAVKKATAKKRKNAASDSDSESDSNSDSGDDDEDDDNGDADADATLPVLAVAATAAATPTAAPATTTTGSGKKRALTLAEKALDMGMTGTSVENAAKTFALSSSQHVLIVGYELFRKHADTLCTLPRAGSSALVCDEGHRLKNAAGNKTIAALRASATRRRAILTGTPVQNDLMEFFAMVDFVNPGALGPAATFSNTFVGPIARARERGCRRKDAEIGAMRAAELARLTASFMLRRRTQSVMERLLPPKRESVVFVGTSAVQRAVYRAVIAARKLFAATPHSNGAGGKEGGMATAATLRVLTMLKKVATHPALVFCSGGAVTTDAFTDAANYAANSVASGAETGSYAAAADDDKTGDLEWLRSLVPLFPAEFVAHCAALATGGATTAPRVGAAPAPAASHANALSSDHHHWARLNGAPSSDGKFSARTALGSGPAFTGIAPAAAATGNDTASTMVAAFADQALRSAIARGLPLATRCRTRGAVAASAAAAGSDVVTVLTGLSPKLQCLTAIIAQSARDNARMHAAHCRALAAHSAAAGPGPAPAAPVPRKVVVISGYGESLDLVAVLCAHARWGFVRLDGTTPGNKRQEIVDVFNKSGFVPPRGGHGHGATLAAQAEAATAAAAALAPRARWPETEAALLTQAPAHGPARAAVPAAALPAGCGFPFVFLLSAQAGGTGLNVVGADSAVLLEPHWNPAVDAQALARIWREGQRRPCELYRLVTVGTVEEKVLMRQMRKGDVAAAVVDTHSKIAAATGAGAATGAASSNTGSKKRTAAAAHDESSGDEDTDASDDLHSKESIDPADVIGGDTVDGDDVGRESGTSPGALAAMFMARDDGAGADGAEAATAPEQQPRFTSQELKALFTVREADPAADPDEPPAAPPAATGANCAPANDSSVNRTGGGVKPADAGAAAAATAAAAAVAECETYQILRKAVEDRVRARIRDCGGRITSTVASNNYSVAAAPPADASKFDPAGETAESEISAVAARLLRAGWRTRFDFFARTDANSAGAVASAVESDAALRQWELLGAGVDADDAPVDAATRATELGYYASRCAQHKGVPGALVSAPRQAVRVVFAGVPTRSSSHAQQPHA